MKGMDMQDFSINENSHSSKSSCPKRKSRVKPCSEAARGTRAEVLLARLKIRRRGSKQIRKGNDVILESCILFRMRRRYMTRMAGNLLLNK